MLCRNCIYMQEPSDELFRKIAQEQCSAIDDENARDLCIKEIFTTLKESYTRLRRIYKSIVFCNIKKTLVVANPDKPTQTIKKCPLFKQKQ